jgi:hypothetical protein
MVTTHFGPRVANIRYTIQNLNEDVNVEASLLLRKVNVFRDFGSKNYRACYSLDGNNMVAMCCL